ncbi:hypothetical protein [Spiroplasma endosymbiont of Agriotes lineatus]|uniref:hypothetical protein n=1 Tax=Spiroplasma endosymbiont of Agriotes lineatus TaxID=3077930 RepID=UPI0030CB6E46
MNIAIGIIFIIISIMLLAYFVYKIYAKIKIRIKYKNAIKNNTWIGYNKLDHNYIDFEIIKKEGI